jgi:hypothetical protein
MNNIFNNAVSNNKFGNSNVGPMEHSETNDVGERASRQSTLQNNNADRHPT